MVEKAHPDFSGYWRLVKTENFDTFLRDVGFAWTLRKAALRFGGSSVDLIRQVGTTVKITSLCAKGSWTRVYDTARAVEQPNAQGEPCTTTASWEDAVLMSRMDGSPLGVVTSARFMAGPSMVVKTSVRLPSGRDTIMFWLFDRMVLVHERVTRAFPEPALARTALLRQLADDQLRVTRATRHDNAYLQRVLLDWDRWRSPADDFILVSSPSYTAARPSASQRLASSAGSGRRLSPPRSPVSKSPSEVSLSALHAAQEAAARAAHVRQQRAALADPSLSLSAGEAASVNATEGGSTAGRSLPRVGTSTSALDATKDERPASPAAISVTTRHGPSSRTSPAIGPADTPAPIQLQLAHKLVEFCESRGIASVVPLASPNDTHEPQLLGMSPEQAEETAAKMAELEADMLLERQNRPEGWNCCGFIITRPSEQVPDYLRVWEMTLLNP